MRGLNVCLACDGDDRHEHCPKGGYTFTEAFRDIAKMNEDARKNTASVALPEAGGLE